MSRTRNQIKHIFLYKASWWKFYVKHKSKIRPSILCAVIKLLSCKSIVRGYHQYNCVNTTCSNIKLIPHTCKSKACSSCGKKLTETWIQKQNQILPDTKWQHIIFTMPSLLWDFFWYNRNLLNEVGKIAASCIKTIADKAGVIAGVFIAIHTFGRNLKRNMHIHLSTTTG